MLNSEAALGWERRLSESSSALDPDELQSMVALQLSEFDMLQSMFPGTGELVVDDPSILLDLREFAEKATETRPQHLDFVLNLDVENGQLHVSVNLPLEYPKSEPDIFVRSQKLSRSQQYFLNQDLMKYLKTFEVGDLCIGPAITWLQENGAKYLEEDSEKNNSSENKRLETVEAKFERLWIYSHHIYSKTKRKDILELAKEFDLTGFCLPGKPGIICVEGLARNTEDWWNRVRTWNWQKILCKQREVEEIDSQTNLSTHRRFTGFEELSSENNIRIKSNGHHVDMGDVFRYLDQHQCGYVFKEYFGVSGKVDNR
ncbi:RWD domain-containing protein 2B isoform X2 [Oratosquilla oratoria]